MLARLILKSICKANLALTFEESEIERHCRIVLEDKETKIQTIRYVKYITLRRLENESIGAAENYLGELIQAMINELACKPRAKNSQLERRANRRRWQLNEESPPAGIYRGKEDFGTWGNGKGNGRAGRETD